MADHKTDANQKFFYFLISGQIEYFDTPRDAEEKSFKTRQVNTVYPAPNPGLVVVDLAAIQTKLQMVFLQKYSRTSKMPPHEITDCVITSCSFLGEYTEAKFMKNAPNNN